jgi:hypothetical protein
VITEPAYPFITTLVAISEISLDSSLLFKKLLAVTYIRLPKPPREESNPDPYRTLEPRDNHRADIASCSKPSHIYLPNALEKRAVLNQIPKKTLIDPSWKKWTFSIPSI